MSGKSSDRQEVNCIFDIVAFVFYQLIWFSTVHVFSAERAEQRESLTLRDTLILDVLNHFLNAEGSAHANLRKRHRGFARRLLYVGCCIKK